MENQRPTFLSILLVLSFISAIWTILNTSLDMFTFDTSNDAVEEQIQRYEDRSKMVESDNPLYDKIFVYLSEESQAKANFLHPLLGGFVAFGILQFICLISMWNLRKKGLMLYSVAVLLTAIWPLILTGASTYSWFYLAVNGATSVLFIGLYSAQYKHLS